MYLDQLVSTSPQDIEDALETGVIGQVGPNRGARQPVGHRDSGEVLEELGRDVSDGTDLVGGSRHSGLISKTRVQYSSTFSHGASVGATLRG